jgi:hypothetical protein
MSAAPEQLEKQPESIAVMHRKVSLLQGACWVFLAIFLASLIPIHPNSGWNVNTRLALIFAVVHDGSLKIDPYHEMTGDKAFFEGHFYSDKIFGASFLAAPFYAAANFATAGQIGVQGAHWASKLGASALPAAASILLLLMLMVRTGTPPRRALLAILAVFFGSSWFGYSTIFAPYAAAIAAALGALYLTLFPPNSRLTLLNSFAIGALSGYALLCELSMAFALIGPGVVFVLRLLDQTGLFGVRAFAEMKGERSRILHGALFALAYAAGVLLPMSLFVWYCYAIFGKFSIPYEYEHDPLFREGMQAGLMGITTPKLLPLWYLTFHPFRGIFFWTPLLLAAVVGAILATRQYGKRRILGWLALWTIAAYVLFNSAYYMWWGGWAMGPRFMIPAVPFLALGLGEVLRDGKLSAFAGRDALAAKARWIVLSLGVISLALTMPLSLTDPQTPQGNETDALLAVAEGHDISLAVPQFDTLQKFYSGQVTLSPLARLKNQITSPMILENLLLLAIYLAIIGLPLWKAWSLLPEQLPGMHRRDYPFKTVDGTAAPPPRR